MLAIAAFVMALGSFVMTLPHFITGTYELGTLEKETCKEAGWEPWLTKAAPEFN